MSSNPVRSIKSATKAKPIDRELTFSQHAEDVLRDAVVTGPRQKAREPMDYHRFHGYSQPPFDLTPDPGLLVLSPEHEVVLDRFYRGILGGQGFLALTGEVGTGKTLLLHTLLGILGEEFQVAYIYNSHLSSSDMIAVILGEFGVEVATDWSDAMRVSRLNKFLVQARKDNRRPLLMIDEAQNLNAKTLEEMRVISNLETPEGKLIQFVLCGQPELVGLLNQPELRQLKQRIGVRANLTGFTALQSQRYILQRSAMAGSKRCPFSKQHVLHIHAITLGIPRLINSVCDALLLKSFLADSPAITLEQLQEVKTEYDL